MKGRILDGRDHVGGVRLLGPAVVAYAAIWPLLQITVVAGRPDAGREAAIAAAATAIVLPLYGWLVVHAVRNRPAPGRVWAFMALTVCIVAVTPAIGPDWLPSHHLLVVSALLALPRPQSWIAAVAVVLSQAAWGQILTHVAPDAPAYYSITATWRAASVFVPISLVAAARQLDATRRELADQAVVRERLRIDEELRTSIAPTLSTLVRRGATVAGQHRLDQRAVDELQALVGDSRTGLADVRRLMRTYQRVSLRGELDTAVVLLRAAGIEARVEIEASAQDALMDDHTRADLNAAVTDLLRNEPGGACVISATQRGDRIVLLVHRTEDGLSTGARTP